MTPPQHHNSHRAVEIVGLVIFVVGVVFWYATPNHVIVPPLIVMAIGAGIALVGHGIRRSQEKELERTLTAHARAQMAQRAQAAAGTPAPATPAPATPAPATPAPATPAPATPAPSTPTSAPPTAWESAGEEPGSVTTGAVEHDLYTAALLVADPQTPGDVLAQLAQEHRQLWDHVRVHPNAYPALIEWMDAVRATDQA